MNAEILVFSFVSCVVWLQFSWLRDKRNVPFSELKEIEAQTIPNAMKQAECVHDSQPNSICLFINLFLFGVVQWMWTNFSHINNLEMNEEKKTNTKHRSRAHVLHYFIFEIKKCIYYFIFIGTWNWRAHVFACRHNLNQIHKWIHCSLEMPISSSLPKRRRLKKKLVIKVLAGRLLWLAYCWNSSTG